MTEQTQLQKLKRHLWIVTGLLGIVTVALVFQYATPVRVGGTVVEAEQFNLLAPDGAVVGTFKTADGEPYLALDQADGSRSTIVSVGAIFLNTPVGSIQMGDNEGLFITFTDSSGTPFSSLTATANGGGLRLTGIDGSEIIMGAIGEYTGLTMVNPEGVTLVSLEMAGGGQRLELRDKHQSAAIIGFQTIENGADVPALYFRDGSQVVYDALGTVSSASLPGNAVNVTGTFIGTYAAESNPGLILQALLQLVQDGTTVTGTLETDANRSATVTGSIEGSQLALNFTFTDECEGIATAVVSISEDGNRLSGNYEADDCLGKYTGEFILDKQ